MTDKPRLVEVTDEEAEEMSMGDDLDAPFPFKDRTGKVYADADELRAWRAAKDARP